MTIRSLLSSALIGAVASARSMTPMATIATGGMANYDASFGQFGTGSQLWRSSS